MTEQFDPNDHTVAEVQEHLASASPDEFARVQEAEAAGKARKGILEFTQAGVAPEALEPSPDGYTRRVVSS